MYIDGINIDMGLKILDLSHEHTNSCNHEYEESINVYVEALKKIDALLGYAYSSEINVLIEALIDRQGERFYREDIGFHVLQKVNKIIVKRKDYAKYEPIIDMAYSINKGIIVEIIEDNKEVDKRDDEKEINIIEVIGHTTNKSLSQAQD
ncbi:hypothetical protein HRbin04_00502 [archaeon HR04]|nr:hypothetical protein HRbin04_00502 [archaeon HR04]